MCQNHQRPALGAFQNLVIGEGARQWCEDLSNHTAVRSQKEEPFGRVARAACRSGQARPSLELFRPVALLASIAYSGKRWATRESNCHFAEQQLPLWRRSGFWPPILLAGLLTKTAARWWRHSSHRALPQHRM